MNLMGGNIGKIVILDTSIDPKHLHCNSFASYSICRKEQKSDCSDISHGTVCEMVFDQFARDYDLVNIQILSDYDEDSKKPMGDICHLKEGLTLCLQLNADIVCLSAVSSILSDSSYLYPVVQKLSKKSIIVSALDNRRYITIPTGYPFAVGVQSDWENRLLPGELAYQRDNDFGAGLYANCDIDLLKDLHLAPSNSFAVPIAAARIHQWMKEDSNPLYLLFLFMEKTAAGYMQPAETQWISFIRNIRCRHPLYAAWKGNMISAFKNKIWFLH